MQSDWLSLEQFIHELHHFFALNRIFFPSAKTQKLIRFQVLFNVTDQIRWK